MIDAITQMPTFYKGVVEDDQDPLQSGRYRVRLIGVDDEDLPINTIPWAPFLNNVFCGVGITTYLKKGTFVFVYLHENDRQQPFIFGVIQGVNNQIETKVFKDPTGRYPGGYKGKPDTNDLARGGAYLKNYVYSSELHTVELDDFGNKVKVTHSSGTTVTITPSGDIIVNGVDNKNETIANNVQVTIGGNATVNVSGQTTMTAGSQTTIKSPTINLIGNTNIQGNITTMGAGGGGGTFKITGDMDIKGKFDITGPIKTGSTIADTKGDLTSHTHPGVPAR